MLILSVTYSAAPPSDEKAPGEEIAPRFYLITVADMQHCRRPMMGASPQEARETGATVVPIVKSPVCVWEGGALQLMVAIC